jgi:hypothetical protein
MDLVFIQSLHHISPLVGMAVKGHMKSYLGSIKSAKLVWPKVEWPRQVKGERIFINFQRTLCISIKVEKNQENLERHGLNMAAQYARFIFVREELVGKSILSCLSL